MRKLVDWISDRFDFTVAGKWLLLGAAVGVASGLGAIVLHTLLQLMRELCLTRLAGLDLAHAGGEPAMLGLTLHDFVPVLVVVLPALGGLVSGLVVYWFAPEAEGHGTDAAIDAYHRKLGRIRSRVPIVKMIASAVTIGTGGSGGREGPIAQIGAGFGSFLATRLGLSTRDRRMLLAAGIGGGIGAIFRAPFAGAIMAAEVLYSSSEVESEVILPAMVSSIVGYAVFASVFGWEHMFSAAGMHGLSGPLELGPYLVLALVVSLAALGYIKSFYGAKALFGRLRLPFYVRSMLGGALAGAIGLVLIFAFGQSRDVGDVLSSGYGVIQHIIDSDGVGVPVGMLLAIGLGKILTTSASIGSGGSGGVFGPSMVIGATLGAAVGSSFHQIMPSVVPHPMTFAIVGMAGFFAAAANAPISTIIMVSELTGDYGLLLPSMWVCAIAFLVSRDWTIFQSQLPSRALALPQLGALGPDVMEEKRVGDLFRRERRFERLTPEMTLAEVARIAETSRQRVFPVVDPKGGLLGAFRIDQLIHAMQEGHEGLVARDLMDDRTFFVSEKDSVDRAQMMLRNNHLEEVLVVAQGNGRKVVGILTVADILLSYQRMLSSTGVPDLAEEKQPSGAAPGAKPT